MKRASQEVSIASTLSSKSARLAPSQSSGVDEEAMPTKPTTAEGVVATLANGVYFMRIDGLPEAANAQALSLRELIVAVRPLASIHFNYCIDPRFVLGQYPKKYRQMPITLIAGQNGVVGLREACANCENVSVAGAALPFQYGTHHSKLSMFESEDALHVVISTANLVEEDWTMKTDAFYYYRAPFKHNADPASLSSAFSLELADYLQRAYCTRDGSAIQRLVRYWLERMNGADFAPIKDRIVATVPGRYTTRAEMRQFGHLRLRALLEERFSEEELRAHRTRVAQFSSIGSLGKTPAAWLCDEFLTSMTGRNTMVNGSTLKLIFPTVENVRNSLEGYEAGGSLPYTSTTNEKQPYLRGFLHVWKSDALSRSRAMPHIKTYTALDTEQSPQWLLLTSANLSHSAWGKLEKGGSQLFCRSYELGVLLCRKDYGEDANETGASGFPPLPYDLPLTKYADSDQPWMVDVRYTKPDAMGRRGL